MLHLVNCTVHANRSLCAGESFVERRLADIGAEAIDGLEACGGVDGQQVRAQTYVGPVSQVCVVEGEMPRAFIGVVCEVDVGDFGKRWARILCERV
jgi:hypothetical protein